ncbi:amidohydrolase family protein [Rhodococcus koreensis]|uniref:amidohydrolase family protein n=1 Tax=Rhodococcus koreensis TaxID=99653 RepID=UPI00366BFE45
MSAMNAERTQFTFVDAHMHTWDLSNGWYPALDPTPDGGEGAGAEHGLGDLAKIQRNYLLDDYFADFHALEIPAVVHVHAGQVPDGHLGETQWLVTQAESRGFPQRIVVEVDPTQSPVDVRKDLEQHVDIAGSRLIGSRVLAGVDFSLPGTQELLRGLASGGWIFDAVAHSGGGLLELAKAAAEHDDLSIVLEHAGWPQGNDDAAFAQWRAEIGELAKRPNVACKLSGFPMFLYQATAEAIRPWLETCVEEFGIERCMVGSNFPVDSLVTDAETLMASYRTITEQYGAEAEAKLYEANTRRFYRV